MRVTLDFQNSTNDGVTIERAHLQDVSDATTFLLQVLATAKVRWPTSFHGTYFANLPDGSKKPK